MQRLVLICLANILMAFASACSTLPIANEGQWIAIGQQLVTGRPERILDDSRCPMNARCITAGRLQIEATVWENGHARKVVIASDTPYPIADGALAMTGILPESFMTDARPETGDYRFRFGFSEEQ